VQVLPVGSQARWQDFLDFPRQLYADDPAWVGPLDMEVRALFDPRKNPHFSDGEAQLWVAYDQQGRPIGRIAAFVYYPKARRYAVPTGGIGFWETIEDYTVAAALLDTAQEWLQGRGLEAADACVNFGENDRFWGVLVEGFDTPPAYGMPYNKPYYADFLARYGFEVYFRQESRELDLRQIPERIIRIGQRAAQKEGVTFAYPEKHRLKKYAHDFMVIYNDAWQNHEHFVPLTPRKGRKTRRKLSAHSRGGDDLFCLCGGGASWRDIGGTGLEPDISALAGKAKPLAACAVSLAQAE
jgi:hypothetical protein